MNIVARMHLKYNTGRLTADSLWLKAKKTVVESSLCLLFMQLDDFF